MTVHAQEHRVSHRFEEAALIVAESHVAPLLELQEHRFAAAFPGEDALTPIALLFPELGQELVLLKWKEEERRLTLDLGATLRTNMRRATPGVLREGHWGGRMCIVPHQTESESSGFVARAGASASAACGTRDASTTPDGGEGALSSSASIRDSIR